MTQEALAQLTGYPALFVLCALSSLAVPVPQDVVLAWAGMQIDMGDMTWLPAVAVAVPGVLLRDVILYWLGRLVGEWILARPWTRRLFGATRIDRARRFVSERGAVAVFLARFMVGMRASIYLAAGVMGMPFGRYVLWDLLGACVTVPLGIVLGYVVGEPVVDGTLWLIQRAQVLTAVLIVAAILAVTWWKLKQSRQQDPASPPGEGPIS